MKIYPDFETFRQLYGEFPVVPVYGEILGDLETPVSAFPPKTFHMYLSDFTEWIGHEPRWGPAVPDSDWRYVVPSSKATEEAFLFPRGHKAAPLPSLSCLCGGPRERHAFRSSRRIAAIGRRQVDGNPEYPTHFRLRGNGSTEQFNHALR